MLDTFMAGREQAQKIFAKSTDKVFGNAGSKDTTMAIVEFDNDILLL